MDGIPETFPINHDDYHAKHIGRTVDGRQFFLTTPFVPAIGDEIGIVGGGELAGKFYDAGLLDEIIVQIGSVTLGSGKPLLPRNITAPPLRLISAQAIGPGFAELRYEVKPT